MLSQVVAMEEEMMVSPAFVKKMAGVRGEEDEETGNEYWLFETLTSTFRQPDLVFLQQCSVQWHWQTSRLQYVR